MREEQLKGWLEENCNTEEAAGQEAAAETAREPKEGKAPGRDMDTDTDTKKVDTGEEREEEEAEYMGTATMELSKCQRVVDLVHAVFGEGWLAEEATWKAAVLIPKGGGDY